MLGIEFLAAREFLEGRVGLFFAAAAFEKGIAAC
jgi:hypothetical protein